MNTLSKQALLSLFAYDENTGVFTRITRTSNAIKEGHTPQALNSEGYVHIRICGKTYKAHRLAWLAVNGEWPSGQIDHINGNRSDNRISNLRIVSNGQNQQNRTNARIDNKSSGRIGVTFLKRHKKWRARIQIEGKPIFLGYFETEHDASLAYQAAKKKHHPCASRALNSAEFGQ